VTDERADRMRIMTPIVRRSAVTDDELATLLEANFDRALDAKFALHQGHVWSVFVHPLSKLDEAQLVDAARQVATLADNYGTTYTSSPLVFGGDATPARRPADREERPTPDRHATPR
jgi:hypothetical protein